MSTKNQTIIERDECMSYIYDKVVKGNYRLDSIIFSSIKKSSNLDDALSIIFVTHPKPIIAFNEFSEYIESFDPETSEEEDMLMEVLDDIKYYKNKYKQEICEDDEQEDEYENKDRFGRHVHYDDDLDF